MSSDDLTKKDEEYYSQGVIDARIIFGNKTGLQAEEYPEMWAAIFTQITSHIYHRHTRKIPITETSMPEPAPVSTHAANTGLAAETQWKQGSGKRSNEEFASENYFKADVTPILMQLRDPKIKKVTDKGYRYELSLFNGKDYLWRKKL